MECCTKGEDCKHCPLIKELPYCSDDIMVDALDLIKHQQAEIERLNTENMLTISERNAFRTSFYEVSKQLKHAKSEAIKEFAERLKELYTDESITDDIHCFIGVIKQNIDDISEEMITRKD